MRIGKQIEYDKIIRKRYFLFFPKHIEGQWRWLEYVEEEGYYQKCFSGSGYFWYHSKYVN
jgi:hypothetical protein